MKALGSLASVLAAVREDGSAEVEAIQREGEAAIARIDAEAAADAVLVSAPASAPAVVAARERARVMVSQEDWEDARAAIASREHWMARAVELGRARLADRALPAERRETLAGLVREALARLPAGLPEIVVSTADADLLDDHWRASLGGGLDPESVRITTGPIDGGCIVRTAEGRAAFDNSDGARSDRLESAWRSQLADIYERATAQIRRNPQDP